MDNNTAVLERQMDETTEPLGRSSLPQRKPWAAPILAVAGLLCIGVAGAVLANPNSATIDAPLAKPQVTVTGGAFEAGHSSGWHVHPGLHSVVVLSGSLTVYDEKCDRHQVGPGDAYLGGDRPHLVRNETSDSATYAVTYVRVASAALDPGSVVPAPRHCDLR